MTDSNKSILLIGESGVGKTHYGAQLLQRLQKGDGQLRMNGAASNLKPFQEALAALNEGLVADHTPISTYEDSVWPIIDQAGRQANLVWPDYGGEQVKSMTALRRVPNDWQRRARSSAAWLLLIRLENVNSGDDIFSRPLASLGGESRDNGEVKLSDQARLVELLQILRHAGRVTARAAERPTLCVLLTCWDELELGGIPANALESRLPLLSAFIHSNWRTPVVMGLSALGRPLDKHHADNEYALRGPDEFGFVIRQDGTRTPDLTYPIEMLLSNVI